MKRVSIILISLMSFLMINYTYAGTSGTSSGRVLNQAVGARPCAMGETFVAVADGIDTIHWNPAGIGNLINRQLSTMYVKGLVDTSYLYLGYGQPLGKMGTFAGSVIALQGGDIEINYSDGSSTTKKAQQDYVLTLSYAQQLQDSLSLGTNLKMINSTLVEDYTATAFALDIGVLYKLMDKQLSLGLVAQNLGTKLKYQEEGDSLPMKIKGGIAYQLNLNQNHNLTTGLDIVKSNDDSLKENIGFEYWFKKTLALRAGYKIDYDLDSLTCGLGFKLKNYHIDYGIAMMGDLDSTHRVSFTMRF